MSKKVILTGLRANSEFHLGNYLGAILPMVKMQKMHKGSYQINMFVPDLHSFTTPIDHTKLHDQILQNLRVFVAAGLDIDDPDTYIYRQSFVPAHSELTWILNCFTHFGEASRMIEFKDKSSKLGSDSVSVGQFTYPILMAADILLYGATYVPLGDDQRQHLEITRDLGERLNNKFKRELFVLPEPWAKQLEFTGTSTSVRIKNLRHPDKKMSKSIDDPNGTIMLTDTPEAARKKIMSAETDSFGVVHFDYEKQPGVTNLLLIYELLSGKTHEQVLSEWENQESYGELKSVVADQVVVFLSDFQQKLSSVNMDKIVSKLAQSEFTMNKVANKTLERVQRAVGLRKKQGSDLKRGGTFTKPNTINFEDFAKCDIRSGTVTHAESVAGSEKLIDLTVDFGDHSRHILTGMHTFYSPEDIIGKQMPFILNLEHREMMGRKSEGMLLAFEGDNGPVLLTPNSTLKNGALLE